MIKPASKQTKQLISKGKKYFLPTYKQREMIISHGKGARIWDIDGNEYIDFGSGIAVNGLGHCDPTLVKALTVQAKKLWHTSNIFYTEPGILLAETLVKMSGFAKHVFFSNSGAEANEAAIKLARKYATNNGRPPEKREIITFIGSFHGRTLTTVTATAQPKYQAGFEPLPQGFVYCPFNDEKALEKLVTDNTCAIMLEPIQGEGGITPAKPGFLKFIRELCDKHGLLMILDEVQSGMSRTGKFFAYQHEAGVKPDIVTVAKGLGGGFPIGGMLVGDKAAETFQFGSHGSTFGGNPLATAVAGAVLKKLQSKPLVQNVKTRSAELFAELKVINKELGLFKEIRGKGLIVGAELNDQWRGKAGDITEVARRHNVLILQAGPDVLRIMPPLTVNKTEMKEGLKRLHKALADFVSHA
ncbi:MAG TPA: aspartate aminotransferase family protein [Rickettsiales bacterium]|nr:aspartate aminotransferase family protein [Rickettsiales bacterium]